MADEIDSDWPEQRKFVLHELGRLSKSVDEVQADVRATRETIAKGETARTAAKEEQALAMANLRFRQSVSGAITTFVPALMLILKWLWDSGHVAH